MFLVIARYRVISAHHISFVRESREWFRQHLAQAAGFRRLLFLRHVTQPEYVDVLTEWQDQASFLAAARHGPPTLRTPHRVLDRFIYETID